MFDVKIDIARARTKAQTRFKDFSSESLRDRMNDFENSLVWKLVKRYRRLNNKWFPIGTRRRDLVEKLIFPFKMAFNKISRASSWVMFDPRLKLIIKFRDIDEEYQIWLKNNKLTNEIIATMLEEINRFRFKPKISIIMPVYNTDERWLRLAINSVINQIYPYWEICIVDDGSTNKSVRKTLENYATRKTKIKVRYLRTNCGIAVASNEALSIATGEFVGFLDHDDEISQDALFEVVKVLNQNPNLDMIYCDRDKKDLKGQRVEPLFKPNWSSDFFLSFNYLSHFMVIRRSLIEKVGGFRKGFEGAQDYDLLLRVTELTDRIYHIPKPFYHWRKIPKSLATSKLTKPYACENAKKALSKAIERRGLKGTVSEPYWPCHYHVQYKVEGNPLVSIVIPIKNGIKSLKRCINSIESKSTYNNYEIIIVDESTDNEVKRYLKKTSHKRLEYTESFNFSKINNLAARYAKGYYLLFLNSDTEVIESRWIEAMLECAQRSQVGAVGSLLIYPEDPITGQKNTIQHAGIILGIKVAGHAFRHLPVDGGTYYGYHRMIRNCIAVTAACMMVRKEVFNEIGGFDEEFKVMYNDVDLCLRLHERGYKVVYNPKSTLFNYETAYEEQLNSQEDETLFIKKWGEILRRGDPYYNPNFSLFNEIYGLAQVSPTNEPLNLLINLYHERTDLQAEFPEVHSGEFQNLIDWAATIGVTLDNARPWLRIWSYWLVEHASADEKDLAKLLQSYNSSIKLQKLYPEVMKGELFRLFAHFDSIYS